MKPQLISLIIKLSLITLAVAAPPLSQLQQDLAPARERTMSPVLDPLPAVAAATSVQYPPPANEAAPRDRTQNTHTPNASTGVQTNPISVGLVLQCGVCTKSPTQPLTTMCGHVYCRSCVLFLRLRSGAWL